MLLLVRHAKAGDRRRWYGPGPDESRHLSAKGWAQAQHLVPLLSGELARRPFQPVRPVAVISSPALRCVQTVLPLAEQLGVELGVNGTLLEGAAPLALEFVHSLVDDDAVLCSHGDVIPYVLVHLRAEFGLALPDGLPVEKASTWVLESSEGRFVAARHLPPPAGA